MPEEKFRLPLSSYDEIAKIIKGYTHLSEPANLDEVSKLTGLHTTIISRNAGFLTAVGILQPGGKKLPTPEGTELGRALEHQMLDEVRNSWRKIALSNDFLSKILTAISIRNGMDESTLEAHIAYSAGQPKKTQFMTGARTIVDILRTAELISEQDGKIVRSLDASEVLPSSPTATTGPNSTSKTIQPVPQATATAAPPNVHLEIKVQIACTPADIDTLSAKLKVLLKELSSPEPRDNDGPLKEA